MESPDENVSRRQYFRQLVAAGGAAALAACLDTQESNDSTDRGVPQGNPTKRPARQHAWNEALDQDEHGNTVPPEHHVLVPLQLVGKPSKENRETVEAAFRSLESAYGYDPAGLLFTVGYAPSYFEAVGVDSPIPTPTTVTSIENPEFDAFDGLVHLASDNPDVVLEAEAALFGGVSEPNGVGMDATLVDIFQRGEPRRTGFVGSGLPASNTEGVGCIPEEMPQDAPFFMGFKSGFEASQAPEDRVTIQPRPRKAGPRIRSRRPTRVLDGGRRGRRYHTTRRTGSGNRSGAKLYGDNVGERVVDFLANRREEGAFEWIHERLGFEQESDHAFGYLSSERFAQLGQFPLAGSRSLSQVSSLETSPNCYLRPNPISGMVLGSLMGGIAVFMLVAGAGLIIAEAFAPGAHFFVAGTGIFAAGLVGVLLPDAIPDPILLTIMAAVVLATSIGTLYAYRELDLYGGQGQGKTSDSASLRGKSGRVTERVTPTDGQVKLEEGGFNPYYQARSFGDEIPEGKEVIVVDPGGGNVLTVESMDNVQDEIDRELERDAEAKEKA